jgi:phosphatidylserine/phosphatidylglycerophosphate/cardiolipin synthase-like enzyme
MPGRVVGKVVVRALLVLLVGYLYQSGVIHRWLGLRTDEASLSPAAGDVTTGDVQVFFTTTALSYPDVPRQRTPPPLLKAVLADIAAAHTSVDLATFDFDIVEIADALIEAKQRGVAVRTIVDSENLETPEVAQQTGRLDAAGIPVRFDDREPFMHKKLLRGVLLRSGERR